MVEFHVVRCYSCQSFQSQQVCKKPKFACKMCGAKQSVRKEYGRGSGKDCRIHVQKLNSMQGNLELEQEMKLEANLIHEQDDDLKFDTYDLRDGPSNNTQEFYDDDGHIYSNLRYAAEHDISSRSNSKWSSYLTNDNADDDDDLQTASMCLSRKKLSPKRLSLDDDEEEDHFFQMYNLNQNRNLGHKKDYPVLPSPKRTTSILQSLERNIQPTGSDEIPFISSQNGHIGPIRLHQSHSQDSTNREKKLCSDPYPSFLSSFSQSSRYSTNFNQELKGRSTSSLPLHQNITVGPALLDQKVSFASPSPINQQLSLEFPSFTLFNQSPEFDDVKKGVIALGEKVHNFDNPKISLSCSEKKDEHIKVVQDRDLKEGQQDTGKTNRLNQIDASNVQCEKKENFFTFIKHSTKASFKKYELSDDIDDIDFDIPI